MSHGYKPGDEPVPGYRLIQFLGRGSFGEVWKAAAPGNTKVALKIIDVRGREGLLESRAIQRIKDIQQAQLVSISAYWLLGSDGRIIEDTSISNLPQASQVYDPAEIARDTICFQAGAQQPPPAELIVVMTLGTKNLSNLLEEYEEQGREGIPVENLLEYMEDAAKGLDYLNAPTHDHGGGPKSIIHGDIKPQNLLIVGDSLQICDFGLAREIDDFRKTATAMGTYAYAAPELLDGHPHVRSDQYCLAVSYMELRTGKLPLFGEKSVLAIADMHKSGRLDFSGLGPCEKEVVRKAAHPDPKQRYNTCREMIRALKKAVDDDSTDRGALRAKIKRAGLAALALLAAALIAAGVWLVNGYLRYRSSPNWFAAQFTDLARQLPDGQDRSTEAQQKSLDLRKNAENLEKKWLIRIEQEIGSSRFSEVVQFLGAAANNAELPPSPGEIRDQWYRLERAWKDAKEKEDLIEPRNFPKYSAAISEIRDAFTPPEEYKNFASREKVAVWLGAFCDRESAQLTSAIDHYLEESLSIGQLIEKTQSIDAIASLPRDAKTRFHDKFKMVAQDLLAKLPVVEAVKQLRQTPPDLFPINERPAVEARLLNDRLKAIRARDETDLDALPGLIAELKDLLTIFPDSDDVRSRLKELARRRLPEPWLPKDCVAAPNAAVESAGSKRLFNRIICKRAGVAVPFVLVMKKGPGDPDTFYIMENKVWNGLYQQFTDTSSKASPESKSESGRADAAGADGADKDQLPKLDVSCDEAFRFAAWLGGTIPSTEQWDKAAGLKDDPGALGPFKGPWPQAAGNISVGRQRPMAVGTAAADVSFFGCRDMAGNGQEWTGTCKDGAIRLPPPNKSDDPPVILRGRDFHRSTPLVFRELGDRSTYDEVESYLKPSSIIGFRVVFDQIPP